MFLPDPKPDYKSAQVGSKWFDMIWFELGYYLSVLECADCIPFPLVFLVYFGFTGTLDAYVK